MKRELSGIGLTSQRTRARMIERLREQGIRDEAVLGPQDAYGLVDLSAALENDKYSIELFANNAFNKHAEVYRYIECAVGACGPEPYVVTNQPRLIGIRFGQKF